MSRHELRTTTSDDVLVDELRETAVDRRLARTRRWLTMALLIIVMVLVAVEMSV